MPGSIFEHLKMDDADLLLFDLAAVFLFVFSLWKIDVSVSALLADGFLTNGFWNMKPMESYHVGLWVSVMSVFWLSFRAITGDLRRKD